MPDTAFQRGYDAQMAWLRGKTREGQKKSIDEAKHALSSRLATQDPGSAYNKGATKATEDYIQFGDDDG